MYNLIRADLYKVSRSKYMKVLFLISTLCAAIMIMMAYWIPQGKLHSGLAQLGLMFSDAHVMSILGAVTVSLLICGDISNKVIHDLIAGGCSRGKVVLSKTIVLCLAIGFLLLPYAIVTGIGFVTGNTFNMGAASVGFLRMLTENNVLAASKALKLVVVMITFIVVYIGQLSIAIPLAFTLKKPLYVIGLYYGFGGLTAQLLLLDGKFPLFDRLFAYTPYGGEHILLSLDTPWTSIMKTILINVLFITIVIALTRLLFKRAEIK